MTATADILIAQKDNVLLRAKSRVALSGRREGKAAEHASTHGAPRVWVERDGNLSARRGDDRSHQRRRHRDRVGPAVAPGARVIVDVVRAERPRTTDNGPRPFG